MRRLVVLAALCALLAACFGGPGRVVRMAPIAKLPALPTVDLEAMERLHGEHDAVFLEVKDNIELTGQVSNLTRNRVRSLMYVVLNPDASWATTFIKTVPSDAKLLAATIEIRNPGQKVPQLFTRDDLIKEKDSDGRSRYKLIYPDVRKGAIIRERYDISDRPSFMSAISVERLLRYSVPVKRLELRFVYPNMFDTQVKRLAANRSVGIDKYHASDFHKEIVLYKGRDLPALSSEAYSPRVRDYADYLHVEIIGGRGNKIVESWTALGEQLAKQMPVPEVDAERVVRDKGNTLGGQGSGAERLQKIVSWVQDNIAVDGRTDDTFEDLLSSRRGSIPAIVTLTGELLAGAGIEADPLFLHDADDGYFDESLPAFDQLDTPSMRAVVDGTTYVFFPYLEGVPVDFLPPSYQGQRGLWLSRRGRVELITTPKRLADQGRIEEHFALAIDPASGVEVHHRYVLHGTLAWSARRAFDRMSQSEIEDALATLAAYDEGEVRFVGTQIEDREQPRAPLTIKLHYTIDNLLALADGEAILQTAGLFRSATLTKTKVDSRKRKLPVRLYEPEERTRSIVLRYPKSWRLQTKLEPQKIKNRFGTVEVKVERMPGVEMLHQDIHLVPSEGAAKDYGELLELLGRSSRLKVPNLIFGTTAPRPAAPAVPAPAGR